MCDGGAALDMFKHTLCGGFPLTGIRILTQKLAHVIYFLSFTTQYTYYIY